MARTLKGMAELTENSDLSASCNYVHIWKTFNFKKLIYF